MLVLIGAFGGCGGSGSSGVGSDASTDPNTVDVSGPVTVRLDKFKDNEVRNESFDSDRSVSESSGNPYGDFRNRARSRLGRDPAVVLVDAISFTLASDSRGVTGFEQIFAGTATVYLVKDAVTVNIGTVNMVAGAGPVPVAVTANRADMERLRQALVDGNFKIGMRVGAARTRPASFDARVSMTVYFRALAQ